MARPSLVADPLAALLSGCDASALAELLSGEGLAKAVPFPATIESLPAPHSPFGALVWRPALRSRHGVFWLACRSWKAAARAADLSLLKQAKAARDPALIAAIAGEIVTVTRGMLGPVPGWTVTAVAPGHSRVSDNFAVLLAQQVAGSLGLAYLQTFQDRFMAGSSHPKTNPDLPPLQWANRPSEPVLLVDDLATSGYHVEEAAGLLRSCGVTVLALTWLSGTAQS